MNMYKEFLNCQQDFSYFSENYIKINGSPFIPHKFQKDLIETYENCNHVAAIKFRAAGYITLTVYYALWKCMFQENQKFYFASVTNRQAEHVAKIISNAMGHFPDWLVPKLDNNTKTYKSFTVTKSSIKFGSLGGIRGYPGTHLVIDEAAFIPNMEEKWKSCFWYFDKKVYVLSTTNGIANWFCDLVMNADKGKNDFSHFGASFRDHPDYQDGAKLKELLEILGERGYLQEIHGSFVSEEIIAFGKNIDNISNEDLIYMTKEKVLHKTNRDCKTVINLLIVRLMVEMERNKCIQRKLQES